MKISWENLWIFLWGFSCWFLIKQENFSMAFSFYVFLSGFLNNMFLYCQHKAEIIAWIFHHQISLKYIRLDSIRFDSIRFDTIRFD
jgi:hypothetical protein